MRRHAGEWAAVAILCAVFASQAVPAQTTPADNKKIPPYALIFGTVYGPDSVPAYGAVVRIQRADGKKLKGGDLSSDHQGEFALRVPAGAADYVIRVEFKPYKNKKLTAEAKVHVNNDERVDVGLHLTE